MKSNELKLHLSTPHEFSLIDELSTGKFSRITQVIHNDIQNNYAKHSFIIDIDDSIRDTFIQICEEIIESQKKLPFILPTIFVIEPKENVLPALITPYYENRSLRDLILKQSNGINIDGFFEPQKMILIYCLSLFLEKLHSKNQFHGKLKASNIIIDNEFHPLVSDLFLYKLEKNLQIEKTVDLMVSLAPEIILDLDHGQKTDIYSFGIIALQIFQQNINIFSNREQTISEIEDEIMKFNFQDIIDIVPESIRSIILKCLSYVPEDRPEASEIRLAIEDIIVNSQFSNMYVKLQNSIQFECNNDENELKQELEKNNIEYLFKYAVKIRQTNEDEALLYFRYGANQKPPHTPSLKYYESITRSRKNKKEPNQLIIESEIKNKFVHLMDDPFFMKTKIDMNAIVDDVNKHINDEETIEFDEEILRKKGFILTKDAKKRLIKIY